jgi:hypothetical protein
MNAYEGLEIHFNSSLTSALGGLSAKLQDPTAFSAVSTGMKKCLLFFLLIHVVWINV